MTGPDEVMRDEQGEQFAQDHLRRLATQGVDSECGFQSSKPISIRKRRRYAALISVTLKKGTLKKQESGLGVWG